MKGRVRPLLKKFRDPDFKNPPEPKRSRFPNETLKIEMPVVKLWPKHVTVVAKLSESWVWTVF